MISDRPYQKAVSTDEALEEIINNAGTQFDPKYAKMFVEMVKKGEDLSV
ncbi:MAG: hypothetical protein PHX62_05260 [Bacilli bacterium]|nr:hypothetical protein [Bacilli bacterium]